MTMNANTNDMGSHFNRSGVSHIEGVLTVLNLQRRGFQPPSQACTSSFPRPGLVLKTQGRLTVVCLIPLHSGQMGAKIFLS